MPSRLHVIERAPSAPGPAEGALVVLVHGSMDRASSFQRVMAKMPDFSIIAYDRRGYAGSAPLIPSAVFSRQVDDLLEVLAGRSAVGVGHSLGGDVVLAAAQHHPDLIDTAMVFEPPQPWLRWWPGDSAGSIAQRATGADRAAEAAEGFMRRVVGDAIWERLPASTRQQRRAEGPTFLAEMEAIGTFPPPFDPALITVPVVCGYGTASRPHHQEGTRRLAAALPDAEIVAVPDANHGAHLSQPAAFADLIRRALRRRAR